jgi:hypothetical protein
MPVTPIESHTYPLMPAPRDLDSEELKHYKGTACPPPPVSSVIAAMLPVGARSGTPKFPSALREFRMISTPAPKAENQRRWAVPHSNRKAWLSGTLLRKHWVLGGLEKAATAISLCSMLGNLSGPVSLAACNVEFWPMRRWSVCSHAEWPADGHKT